MQLATETHRFGGGVAHVGFDHQQVEVRAVIRIASRSRSEQEDLRARWNRRAQARTNLVDDVTRADEQTVPRCPDILVGRRNQSDRRAQSAERRHHPVGHEPKLVVDPGHVLHFLAGEELHEVGVGERKDHVVHAGWLDV